MTCTNCTDTVAELSPRNWCPACEAEDTADLAVLANAAAPGRRLDTAEVLARVTGGQA